MESTKALILPGGNAQTQTGNNLKTGSIFFIGTATVILRYAGFTILTDPNFLHAGEHIRLGYGLRSVRQTNPAINIEDLPPLDLVLLSHLHEDHFDRVAEQKLDKRLPIITTPQSATILSSKGFTAAQSLKTWETFTVTKGEARLRITSMPGRHGPGALTLALPSVMGSMLEFQSAADKTALRVYITGDTLFNEDLREIPKRYPEVDIALLHLGGTRIMGLMLTMDGKQGAEVVKIIAPNVAIPIHYNDYPVFKSPLEDFKKAVEAAELQERVHYLSHGETYDFDVPPSRYE